MDERVPSDHVRRKIGRVVDVGFIHDWVKDLYGSDNGRPAFRASLRWGHSQNPQDDSAQEVGHLFFQLQLCQLHVLQYYLRLDHGIALFLLQGVLSLTLALQGLPHFFGYMLMTFNFLPNSQVSFNLLNLLSRLF